MNRLEALDALRQEPDVDVLIIGGGINGVGTFRDLALQGVNVVLAERGDFGSGASAASSHMAHGGIRYLENGEFRLVREALRERNRMLLNAPHYVKPLPTTIPIFKWFSGILNAPLKFLGWLDRPSERGAVVIKIGMALYDWYVRDFRVMPTHEVIGREESLRRYPNLNPAVRFTGTYYDGQILAPERLCVELVLDAEADHPGARAFNYLAVVGAEADTVILRDELSGDEVRVRPRVVINAAGPWIDFANRALGVPTTFIGGTKGSHLVLDHLELRKLIGDHEFFFENKDGRIVLILPYFDRVMVGTSDIHIDDPDQARVTEQEIDYFIGMIDRVFPGMKVDRSHIVFGFTGVRPLPTTNAKTAGQISRDHEICVSGADAVCVFPVLSLVGGKWTSYRAFSEEAADAALKRIGVDRKADTCELAIGGGKNYPKDEASREAWLREVQEESGLAMDRVRLLFERYGTRAREIAMYVQDNGDEPLRHAPDHSRGEIAYLARCEKVERLADVALRRTLLAMLGRVTLELVEELGGVIGDALGWDPDRRRAEVEDTLRVLREQFYAPTVALG